MQRTFDTPQPIQLYVENHSGHVRVTADDVAQTEVGVVGPDADEFRVEQRDNKIQVVAPQRRGFLSGSRGHTVTVIVPTASTVTVRSASSDIRITGTVTGLWVDSASGDLTAEAVDGPYEITTGSGDIDLTGVTGPGLIKSGSGDVEVGRCGQLTVSTGSGDVQIDRAEGEIVAKTGSGDFTLDESLTDVTVSTGNGDITVRTARGGRIKVRGASGDVAVGVPTGTPIWTDISTISGSLRSSLEPVGAPAEGQDHLELHVTLASGDVVLTPR